MNYVKKSILSLALCVLALNLNSHVFAMENGAGEPDSAAAASRRGPSEREQQIAALRAAENLPQGATTGVHEPAKPRIRRGKKLKPVLNRLGIAVDPSAEVDDEAVEMNELPDAAAGAGARTRRASEGDVRRSSVVAGANVSQPEPRTQPHPGPGPDMNLTLNQPSQSQASAPEVKAAVADAAAAAGAGNTPVKPESYLDRFNELSKEQKTRIGVGAAVGAVVAGGSVVAYKKNTRFQKFVDSVGAGVKNNFNYYVGDPVKNAYKNGITRATAIKAGAGVALTGLAGYGVHWLNKNGKLEGVKAKANELKDAAKANPPKAIGVAALATLAGAAAYKVYKYATGAKQTKTDLILIELNKTIEEKQRTESVTKLLSAAQQDPLLLRDPAFYNRLSDNQRKLVQAAIEQWIADNPNAVPQWKQEIVNLGKLLEPTVVNNKIIYDAFTKPLDLKGSNFEQVKADQKKTVEDLVQIIIKLWTETKPETLPEWQSDILKLGQAIAKTAENDRVLNIALYNPHEMIMNSKFFNSLGDKKNDVKEIIAKWNSLNPDAKPAKQSEFFATFIKQLDAFAVAITQRGKHFTGFDQFIANFKQSPASAKDIVVFDQTNNPDFWKQLDQNEQFELISLLSLAESL